MPSLKTSPIHHQTSLLSPIQPPKPQQKHITPPNSISASTQPLPTPLHWLWQCHICQQKYPLGATRRCLEDGHFFCAGVTIMRKRRNGSGKTRAVAKRHVPCASEFDYQGWLEWGEWRRAERSKECKKDRQRDCWGCCDYPSECRWGSHIGNIPGSVAAVVSIPERAMRRPQGSLEIPPEERRDQASSQQKFAMGQQPPTTFDGILEVFEVPRDKQHGEVSSMLKEVFWSGIPVSLLKREGSRGKSLLGTVVENEESGQVR